MTDTNLTLCFPPTPSLLHRLSTLFATLLSSWLSGPPPFCVFPCVSAPFGFFLCRCLSVSACASLPAVSLSSVSFLLCLSRLGGEGNLLLTSTPPHRPSLPCPPSPGQPTPVPLILYSGGRGPLSPWPRPLKLSPASLPLFPLWLASLPAPTPAPPRPLPLSSLSFVCVCSSPSPHPCHPAPSLGSFLLPLTPWLTPSLVLDNYQIYQWGQRSRVCVVLALWTQGVSRTVFPVLAPVAG